MSKSDPAAIARWHMAAAKIERDVRLSDLTDAEIVMLIEAVCREAEARGEERERCAGIAENIAPHFRNPMGDAIAAAIRAAPSSQRGD